MEAEPPDPNHTYPNVVHFFIIVCILFSIYKLCMFIKWLIFRRKPKFRVKGLDHEFHVMQIPLLSRPMFCNVCTALMTGLRREVVFCVSCGLAAHLECVRNTKCPCKPKCVTDAGGSAVDLEGNVTTHHWVQGNLELSTVCIECELACGSLLSLEDYHCAWCQETVHTDCMKKMTSQVCPLGPHSKLLLPPSAVRPNPEYALMVDRRSGASQQLRRAGSRIKSVAKAAVAKARRRKKSKARLSVVEKGKFYADVPPVPEYLIEVPRDSSTLLVFINPKSGGNYGLELLRHFRLLLNPLQVIDLSEENPMRALVQFQHVPGLRVLFVKQVAIEYSMASFGHNREPTHQTLESNTVLLYEPQGISAAHFGETMECIL
eukprot:Rmarinus@m.28110